MPLPCPIGGSELLRPFLTSGSSCLILSSMDSVFDPLKFYDELKAADVPEKQARAQAEAMRNAFAAYDASKMNELAKKGDLSAVRHELRDEMRASELRILKWVIGTIITQTALIIAVIGIAVAILLK